MVKKAKEKIKEHISATMESFRKGKLIYRGKKILTRDEAKVVALKGTNIK